jgi:hypothetical protein
MAALVAPGARATELEPSVEALKFVVLPSDGASVNVVEEHAAVSLFLTVMEYTTLPPFAVMVWDGGVMVTVGALAVQVAAADSDTVMLSYPEGPEVPDACPHRYAGLALLALREKITSSLLPLATVNAELPKLAFMV